MSCLLLVSAGSTSPLTACNKQLLLNWQRIHQTYKWTNNPAISLSQLYCKLTAIDVMEDFENNLSASLNFLFLLSAFEFVLLLVVKYLSHPLMMFPYNWVSSKYEPSKAYIWRSRFASVSWNVINHLTISLSHEKRLKASHKHKNILMALS